MCQHVYLPRRNTLYHAFFRQIHTGTNNKKQRHATRQLLLEDDERQRKQLSLLAFYFSITITLTTLSECASMHSCLMLAHACSPQSITKGWYFSTVRHVENTMTGRFLWGCQYTRGTTLAENCENKGYKMGWKIVCLRGVRVLRHSDARENYGKKGRDAQKGLGKSLCGAGVLQNSDACANHEHAIIRNYCLRNCYWMMHGYTVRHDRLSM